MTVDEGEPGPITAMSDELDQGQGNHMGVARYFKPTGAYAESWQRSEEFRLARGGGGVPRVASYSRTANCVILLAVVLWLVLGNVPRDAQRTFILSCATVAGTLTTVCMCYAITWRRGLFPGFAEDDYRLSIAFDSSPATETAVLGLMISLDLLPAIEWSRPFASHRAARAVLSAFAAEALVHVAATPISLHRKRHSAATLGFFLSLTAYEIVTVATVPGTLASASTTTVSYVIAALFFASLLYVIFGIFTWIKRARLWHMSVAEIILIIFLSIFTLVLTETR